MTYYSKELLMQFAYKKNQVVGEYTVPNTYTLEIKASGKYEIEAVSGGAGGCSVWAGDAWYNGAYGSTGCYYKNTFYITKGTYSITIGSGGAADGRTMNSGGDTIFSDYLHLKGGQGATIPYSSAGAVGTGGYKYIANTSDTGIDKSGYAGYFTTANALYWGGGPQLGPQKDYSLGAYGQGGYGSTEKPATDPRDGLSKSAWAGTGGYLKITYKGRS